MKQFLVQDKAAGHREARPEVGREGPAKPTELVEMSPAPVSGSPVLIQPRFPRRVALRCHCPSQWRKRGSCPRGRGVLRSSWGPHQRISECTIVILWGLPYAPRLTPPPTVQEAQGNRINQLS